MFEIQTNHIAPARGRILISEPLLVDHTFQRSVVLLVEHNENESLGFILNTPVQVLGDFPKKFPHKEIPIFYGGPVRENYLYFIYRFDEKLGKSLEIGKHTYWGWDMSDIDDALDIGLLNKDNTRFFLGYSGWEANQLENELDRNSWAVSILDFDKIFHFQPEYLWEEAVKGLGDKYQHWTKLPINPHQN